MVEIILKFFSCRIRKATTKAQISCADTAQLISTFVFAHIDSRIFLLSKAEISRYEPDSVTAQTSMSDMGGNPKEHAVGRISSSKILIRNAYCSRFQQRGVYIPGNRWFQQ